MASLSRPYSKKIIIILLHIIVWILFFSVPLLLRSPFDNRRLPEIMLHPPHFNLFHTLRDIMMVGIFYLNAYLFLPQVINEKKFNRFILWQLLLFLPFILLNKLFFDWLIGFSLRPNNTMARIIFFRDFLPYLLMLASSTAYRMIIDRIRVERITKERENENLKTELLLLRSQISPHFMFNILNNMVSLARKKSDQLEPSLIKLSFLMRYIFYEVREDKVPLQKEIEYIQSYIDLQEQRFSGGVVVKTDIQCCPENYLIEPMLLIPFVENAFKHGTTLIKDAEIDINLRVINQVLCFFISNKFNKDSDGIKDSSTGIGLANVKRRLTLLYGDHYQLQIITLGDWHTVSLQLNLN